jgi:hypothetical protein
MCRCGADVRRADRIRHASLNAGLKRARRRAFRSPRHDTGIGRSILDFGGTPSMCILVSNREKPMDTPASRRVRVWCSRSSLSSMLWRTFIGEPSLPVCCWITVSFQPARQLSQKIAADTRERGSSPFVASAKSDSATWAVALVNPVAISSAKYLRSFSRPAACRSRDS